MNAAIDGWVWYAGWTDKITQVMPIALAECLATSDVPGGVVNILTGHQWELAPVLASHLDVDAIDLTGAQPDELTELEVAAAGNVKRVVRASTERSPQDVTAFQEMKTVWHPKGA